MGDSEVTILTDPFESESTVRFPRTITPDILVLSHQDRSRFNLEGALGTPFIVSDPGEYEVKGAFVTGVQDPTVETGTQERPVIYRFLVEGISIAFLGQLKRKLTDREVEALENVDILLLPVGGGDVMDSKLAGEIITEVEPRMVIPMYYDLPGLKMKLAGVDAFCKSVVCKRQDMNKLKISKKDLPTEDMLITVLERA